MLETVQGSAWNILLVDDDEDDFILIRQMLSDIPRMQINVEWASGYRAATSIDPKAYDALLVDYDLGVRTGLELIKKWESEDVETPMIVVTGRGSYENDVESMEAGAVDYLSKSDLSGPLLERAIRYAIEQKSIEKELEARVEVRTRVLQQTTEHLRANMEELKVMEEELRAQNEELVEVQGFFSREQTYYQDLFQHAPIGYIVTDKAGKITTANLFALAILKTQLQMLVGKPLQSFIDQSERSGFRDMISRMATQRAVESMNYTIHTGNGDSFECWMFVAPFLNSKGKVEQLQWVIVGKDVNAQAEHGMLSGQEDPTGKNPGASSWEQSPPMIAMPAPQSLEDKINDFSQKLRQRLLDNQDLESLVLLKRLHEGILLYQAVTKPVSLRKPIDAPGERDDRPA